MYSFKNNVKSVLEIMSSIGSRLIEERKRLGYSQSGFGELGGVKRQAQGNYESDDRRPDAEYLAAIANAGADITYIVLGTKPGVNYEKRDEVSSKTSAYSVRSPDSPQYSTGNAYDSEMMEFAIECAELYITEADKQLTPHKKAKLIRILYDAILDDEEHQPPEASKVIDLVELASREEQKNKDGENNGRVKKESNASSN